MNPRIEKNVLVNNVIIWMVGIICNIGLFLSCRFMLDQIVHDECSKTIEEVLERRHAYFIPFDFFDPVFT